MIKTPLTRWFDLSTPIIGAPMAGVSGGAMARAVSAAGGLGMIGISGAHRREFVTEQCAIPAAAEVPFGVGLMVWVLDDRPDLLEATIEAQPSLVSVSFGDPAPYVGPLHDAGIAVASQVNTTADVAQALDAGVDVLVAQGTDAGGHTGSVGTMPLLQRVLEIGDAAGKPVVAAGGIATGRGIAGALAMGAAGAWIGRRFCATRESLGGEEARRRILEAGETGTVHTRVFDVAQGIPWPEEFPGRALRNSFTARWHGREEDLRAQRSSAATGLEEARERGDYSEAYIYAGQAAGLVNDLPPAGELVGRLVVEAEARLRACRSLFSDGSS